MSLLLLSSLVLSSPLPLQESSAVRGAVSVEGLELPYRLLKPEGLSTERRYPLVLFLHGAGERGADNERQLAYFPERMETPGLRSRHPAFVLAPQCPEGHRWVEVDWSSPVSTPFPDEPSPAMLGAIAALREVVRDHPVDPSRIYLTGLSMGGFGVWDLATRHPEWFAAAAPICGGGDEGAAVRLVGLPLWAWHGAEDPVVAVSRSRGMVGTLERLGQDVRYTELEDRGHDVWHQAYGDGDFLDWMFRQRRDLARLVDARARRLANRLGEEERVAFLGDSITEAGAGDGGYVDLLRRVLVERRPGVSVIPAGISGHRVPDLIARYREDVIAKQASLVFVYIGINDVWHSEFGSGTPIEDYERLLDELVGELRASGARVVLATPSVIGEEPGGANRLDGMLDDYAERSRRVAARHALVVCDLRRAFVEHLALFNGQGRASGVLTSDGVHLSEEGNLFVAFEAAEALRAALQLER